MRFKQHNNIYVIQYIKKVLVWRAEASPRAKSAIKNPYCTTYILELVLMVRLRWNYCQYGQQMLINKPNHRTVTIKRLFLKRIKRILLTKNVQNVLIIVENVQNVLYKATSRVLITVK